MLRLVRKHRSTRALTGGIVMLMLTLPGFFTGTAYAGPFTRGVQRTTDVVIPDPNNWTSILTISIASSAHSHTCVVVGSLDAKNPLNDATNQDYYFTISLDNANPVKGISGVERQIELREQGSVNEPGFWPVSTNTTMTLSANVPHTIRLLGRRQFGSPNLVVDDAVLSVVCV